MSFHVLTDAKTTPTPTLSLSLCVSLSVSIVVAVESEVREGYSTIPCCLSLHMDVCAVDNSGQ